MASNEEGSEPLQSKTYVLKVSIHCEGCKKKVSRILKNVGGVYKVEIDSQQNKVTVTGNLDAETLIRKLQKSGKHAELWPIEKKPSSNSNPNPNPSNNNNTKGKNKEKGKDADKEKDASKSNEPNEPPEKKPEKSAAAAKNSETDTKLAAEPAPATTEKVEAAGGKNPAEIDTKSGTEVSETSNREASASKSDPKPEKSPAPDTATNSGGGGGGGGGKKKGKKEAEPAASNEGFVMNSVGAPPHPAMTYQVPAYPPPVYAASYNMLQSTPSYSYYAPVPPTPQSYMYSGGWPPEYYPQYPPHYPNYYHDNYYGPMGPPAPAPASSSPSQGSYDFFSDENANSCSVM